MVFFEQLLLIFREFFIMNEICVYRVNDKGEYDKDQQINFNKDLKEGSHHLYMNKLCILTS